MKSYTSSLLWGVVNFGIGIYNLLSNNSPWIIALSFGLSALMFSLWFQEFPRTYIEAKPKQEEDLYK